MWWCDLNLTIALTHSDDYIIFNKTLLIDDFALDCTRVNDGSISSVGINLYIDMSINQCIRWIVVFESSNRLFTKKLTVEAWLQGYSSERG